VAIVVAGTSSLIFTTALTTEETEEATETRTIVCTATCSKHPCQIKYTINLEAQLDKFIYDGNNMSANIVKTIITTTITTSSRKEICTMTTNADEETW
jgi:hypothetical protein